MKRFRLAHNTERMLELPAGDARSVEPTAQPSDGLPIGMAIVGLATLGIQGVAAASASAPVSSTIHHGQAVTLESILTQAVLVGTMLALVAIGLTARSRVAFIVALLLGAGPLVPWMGLVAAQSPVATEPVVVRLAAGALLILAGLALAAPSYWRRRTA